MRHACRSIARHGGDEDVSVIQVEPATAAFEHVREQVPANDRNRRRLELLDAFLHVREMKGVPSGRHRRFRTETRVRCAADPTAARTERGTQGQARHFPRRHSATAGTRSRTPRNSRKFRAFRTNIRRSSQAGRQLRKAFVTACPQHRHAASDAQEILHRRVKRPAGSRYASNRFCRTFRRIGDRAPNLPYRNEGTRRVRRDAAHPEGGLGARD